MKLRWDVFCHVVDNHGDVGVAWRFCHGLHALGHRVRLFIDDPSALEWLAPNANQSIDVQAWPSGSFAPMTHSPPDVLVEMFGCEPAPAYLQALSVALQTLKPAHPWAWINLEYLSAEPYVERMHQLPSPQLSGPLAGQTKWFFYPGFTAQTGGLIHPRKTSASGSSTLEIPAHQPWVLFCYEPPALADLLQSIKASPTAITLEVCAGKTQQAVLALLKQWGERPEPLENSVFNFGRSRLHFLPYVSQSEFDALLARSALNFVRGEDSLLSALWAAKPFIWQIYPQSDGAHEDKLMAFLQLLKAPESLVRAHMSWNHLSHDAFELPQSSTLAQWSAWASQTRAQLLGQSDLCWALQEFVLTRLNPSQAQA
jgi:uncharacterized repeat protein (TIGR03837 family)